MHAQAICVIILLKSNWRCGSKVSRIQEGYSTARPLSLYLIRLRLPYELGFFIAFVADSITISALVGLF